MSIVISKALLEEIHEHGIEGYPNEICGFIMGHVEDGKKIIKQVMRAKNEWGDEGEHYNRFHISPQASMKAERFARKNKLDILGCYHTHPDCEAVASKTDLEYAAWDDYSFLILSVVERHPKETRSWLPLADRSKFEEESVEIVD